MCIGELRPGTEATNLPHMQGHSQDFYGGGGLFSKIWTPTGDFSISTSSIVP